LVKEGGEKAWQGQTECKGKKNQAQIKNTEMKRGGVLFFPEGARGGKGNLTRGGGKKRTKSAGTAGIGTVQRGSTMTEYTVQE